MHGSTSFVRLVRVRQGHDLDQENVTFYSSAVSSMPLLDGR